MRFDKQVISVLTIGLSSINWNAEAFAPRLQSNAVIHSPKGVVSFHIERLTATRLFMVEDDVDDEDDDDDDNDDDDPLGDGIDSVAWLPSVIGARGKTITSAREVSQVEIELGSAQQPNARPNYRGGVGKLLVSISDSHSLRASDVGC